MCFSVYGVCLCSWAFESCQWRESNRSAQGPRALGAGGKMGDCFHGFSAGNAVLVNATVVIAGLKISAGVL
jgi:hypothetical protein